VAKAKQKDAVEKLKLALRMLNDKIEEAKRKKNVLIARKKRAEAQKAIQETMSGLKDQSAFETFDRMAQKIDQIEAEAEAGEELAEEYTGDVLAHKFASLEKTAGADDELAALKRKMGLLPAEEKPAATKEEVQARVEAPPPSKKATTEEDQLAAALEEMEAEQQQEQKKMGR
jgi:phage shock protein A